MSRSHDSVVIYSDQIPLPKTSIEKLEAFQQWLSDQLATLEARWSPWAAPRARRVIRAESNG